MINLIKQNWKLLCSGAGIGMASVHLTDGRFTWAIIASLCGLAMFVWHYLTRDKNALKPPYTAPNDLSL